MKSIAFSAFAAAVLLATTAQAGVDAGLSRNIESKVNSAHSRAAAAQAAFDAGNANQGCRALVGAARDLDKSIDMGINLIDSTTSDRSMAENSENHSLITNMRSRLAAIVEERDVVQGQLEQRCRTTA